MNDPLQGFRILSPGLFERLTQSFLKFGFSHYSFMMEAVIIDNGLRHERVKEICSKVTIIP